VLAAEVPNALKAMDIGLAVQPIAGSRARRTHQALPFPEAQGGGGYADARGRLPDAVPRGIRLGRRGAHAPVEM
jgi:hypothetical protein